MVRPMIDHTVSQPSFFGRSRLVLILTVLVLLAGGLALRLTNLTAPPFDVHAWRQLRSASIARGMFFNLEPAANPGLREQANYLSVVYGALEPPLFERLVAQTYLILGQEVLWVARLYSILFWLLTCLLVFFIARQVTNTDGAVVALAFTLFLPFGVSISRAFMPEPLYILWMWAGIFVFYRWVEKRTWVLAALAGIFIGVAILVKVFAAFMLIPAVAFYLVARIGLRQTIKNFQFYLLVALSGLIPAVYYFWIVPGQSDNYLATWSLPYLHLLLDPAFYIRWFHWLSGLFNPAILVLAALSILFFRKLERWLVLGLWVGYLVFGLTLPSLITSHSYYSLPLVPIVGLSLAGLGAILLPKLAAYGKIWQTGVLVLLLISMGDASIMARKEIMGADYTAQATYWKNLSADLPDGRYVGLVADYGASLNYYGWRFISMYPSASDLDMARMGGKDFNFTSQAWEFFLSYTRDYDYFLVTELNELDAQPYLRQILTGYYPVARQEKDYLVFDLKHPIKSLPTN
jgi:4-amino-4-deoxy-L-arabinose transferase-like glycosyltransferase